jgi:SAM-dependent methyltransferase
MATFGLIIILAILCFSVVVFVGPPYLPTLTKQVTVALDMLDLKPGDTMIELGCGDGKVLLAAARRGWNVVGIELNPILALLCRLRTWRYRKQVKVVLGNYWLINTWPPAQGIFGFVLPKYMSKLDECITWWQTTVNQTQDAAGPVKLASFAFTIPGKKVIREQDGVFLYEYRKAPSR